MVTVKAVVDHSSDDGTGFVTPHLYMVDLKKHAGGIRIGVKVGIMIRGGNQKTWLIVFAKFYILSHYKT